MYAAYTHKKTKTKTQAHAQTHTLLSRLPHGDKEAHALVAMALPRVAEEESVRLR